MKLPPPTDLADRRAAKNRNEAPGAGLLDEIEAFCRRFIAYPDGTTATAHTLWIAHTHRMGAWDNTPRLAVLSPEPGSGKTRVLEVTKLLVPRPVHSIGVSVAYITRKINVPVEQRLTLLFDEIDTVFGWKVRADNEDIRGLFNAGHRRGAITGRAKIVGKEVKTEELPAYCAAAMAGIGDCLPDTLLDRSVVMRMRKRKSSERVEPFRERDHEAEGHGLRDRLADWMEAMPTGVWPELPPEITDRNADKWESLVMVADYAGGSWPERARRDAVTAVTASRRDEGGLGRRLLADLWAIFREDEAEGIFTTTLVDALARMEGAPWAELRKGQPIDANRLAKMLGKYEVESKTVRRGSKTLKGYRREDLVDPWERYVPGYSPSDAAEDVTGVTEVTDLDDLAAERNAAHLAGPRAQIGR